MSITNLDYVLEIPDTEIDDVRRYHAEEDYVPSNRELMFDNSSMPTDISDNLESLALAAKNSMKNRASDEPFYDWKTKNKSFIKVYSNLRKRGIKRNKFFLRLYDTSLQGVDVYSPVLPVETQLRMILECFINPWYWLREVCRIPADGTPIEPGGGVQYQLDENNLACWYLFLNGIAHYQSKPRQCGKTQNALAEQNYAYHFGATSATFLFFNKDQNLAKTNLYRFKTQRDLLPSWMQMRSVITEDGKIDKGIDNITTMENPITHNMIRVMPKAQSPDSANGIGRGYTAAFHHFDEVDFIPYQITIMDASAFSFATASANSWANGGLACRIFTSTPGDANSKTGKAANQWIDGMLKWEDKMFDWSIERLRKEVEKPGKTPVVFVEHSWKQLGKSVAWYEEQCRLVSYKEERILNEIDLKRIAGNELSPFKRSDLLYITRHIKEPIGTIPTNEFLPDWLVYKKLVKSYPYILSIDPAEGLTGDNCACTLINPYTLDIDAEFKSNFVNQTLLSRLIVAAMDKYFPNAMIVVEANRGRELIHRLLETKYASNMYYDIDKLNSRIHTKTDEYGEAYANAARDAAWGFNTTPSSRPKLFSILENLMYEDKDKLCSQHVSTDIMGLIRKSSGRIEAGDGYHDDNIMSYLIGLRVYYDASNLEEFGIYRGATEPKEVTKENKAISAIKGLMESIPSLSGELQELLGNVLKDAAPAIGNPKGNYINKMSMEAQRANREFERAFKDEVYKDEEYEDDRISTYRDRYDDSDWDRIDEQIMQSNFSDPSSEVHIEDLF